jgi:hypothetical protein
MSGPLQSAQTRVARGIAWSRGVRWWADAGAWLFGDLSRLGAWIGMGLCLVVILTVLHWIPLVGQLAAVPLWFVLNGGLMIAADRTARGAPVAFADLFLGFGEHGGALVGAGVVTLLLTAAVFGLLILFGAGAVMSAVSSATSLADFEVPSAAAIGLGWGAAIGMLACLTLFMAVGMAAWLAPALIVLYGTRPADALRTSLSACWSNLGALSVYGLLGIGLAMATLLTLGVAMIVLVPLSFLSSYAALRDLVVAEVEVIDPLPGR